MSYIDKSRVYYAAHGYEHPYRWAHHDDVPMTVPSKPLAVAKVAIVTTSAPVMHGEKPGSGSGSNGVRKRAYAHDSDPTPTEMFTADLSWDKDATHTDDVGTFLPLELLATLAADGLIGSVSPRFYGVPTDYSQRRTTEIDGPDVVAFCLEDEVDIVVLVPL